MVLMLPWFFPSVPIFKQYFKLDIQSMFDRLVDLTESICQRIDENKVSVIPPALKHELYKIVSSINRITKQLEAI